MYPYIDKDKHSLPTKEEKRKLYKNIGAMSMHKIGAVCVYNTDSLLMSAFVGLRSVGIYSNYRLILSSVSLFSSRYSLHLQRVWGIWEPVKRAGRYMRSTGFYIWPPSSAMVTALQ